MSEFRRRSGVRRGTPAKKVNYRLILLIVAAAGILLSIILLFQLGGKNKTIGELQKQKDELTAANQAVENEKNTLTQELGALYQTQIAALPAPKRAQTAELANLIPQLTDTIYVIRGTEGQYDYVAVPKGILYDKLLSLRVSPEITPSASSGMTAGYWVLYENEVVGLAMSGGQGFISSDRGISGPQYIMPQTYTDFVASLFRQTATTPTDNGNTENTENTENTDDTNNET